MIVVMDCVCCMEKIDENLSLKCECGIATCFSCMREGTRIAIQDFKKMCCYGPQCGKEVSIDTLNVILPHSLFDKYNEVSVSIDMAKMGISARDNEQEEITEDYIKTLDLVIKCCGVIFVRGDACNKVSCPICKLKYCWICKEQIQDYSHYRNSLCELYGEREEILMKIEEIKRLDQIEIENFWENVTEFIRAIESGMFNTTVPRLPNIRDRQLICEPLTFLVNCFADFLGRKCTEMQIEFLGPLTLNLACLPEHWLRSIQVYFQWYKHESTICKGTKKNGDACTFKTKNVYCKIHIRQAPWN